MDSARYGTSVGHDTDLKTPVIRNSDYYYLTRMDPPSYSSATSGTAIHTTMNKQHERRPNPGGADYGSEQGSARMPSLTSSSIQTSEAPLLTRYEELEHLSDSHRPQQQRTVSTPMLQAQSGNDSRTHPTLLTERIPKSYCPFFPERMSKSTIKSKTKGFVCVSVFIIFSLVISLGALALNIYLLIANNAALAEYTERLNRMQEETEHLQKENLLLKNGSLQTSFIQNVQYDLSSLMEEVRDLNARISNISVAHGPPGQPGPQGPPGSLNFSSCFYENYTRNITAGESESALTDYLPQHPEKYFVMFAYCTHEKATNGMLVASANTTYPQYSCKCWRQAQGTGSGQIECTAHVLMCPRGG